MTRRSAIRFVVAMLVAYGFGIVAGRALFGSVARSNLAVAYACGEAWALASEVDADEVARLNEDAWCARIHRDAVDRGYVR